MLSIEHKSFVYLRFLNWILTLDILFNPGCSRMTTAYHTRSSRAGCVLIGALNRELKIHPFFELYAYIISCINFLPLVPLNGYVSIYIFLLMIFIFDVLCVRSIQPLSPA